MPFPVQKFVIFVFIGYSLGSLYETGYAQADSIIVRKRSWPYCNQQAHWGKKLLRAEIISFTLQAGGYLALALMPPESTHWHVRPVRENYKRAFTRPPVWDNDVWQYNYLGHPITGSIHYNILRSQDVPAFYAFLYSTAQSVIWEYLWEASQERPSIQDLLFTSTIGSVVGECMHVSTIALKRNRFTVFEKILVTLINPAYVINNGYKKTSEKHIWWKNYH
ncbi:MAG: hypothetical protein KatS3mg031_1002 [Chitinophagales bacterium]|nr:MAG: hypothetical protein KatS3mg031_1002 [Chitinophagales bacterium]